MKRLLTYALPGLTILMIALVLGLFAFRQNTNCQSVEDVRNVIRTILVNSKNAVIASPDITTAQRVAIVKFYDTQIGLLPPHAC